MPMLPAPPLSAKPLRHNAVGAVKRLAVTVLLCAIASPVPLWASTSCYSAKAFEADRGLRMHEDLEVINLTCHYSTQGAPLQPIYSDIINRYGDTIHGWEETIAHAFGHAGHHDEVVDNFRTHLANEKGNEAGRMGPKAFCQQWANFIPYVASLTPQQLHLYLLQPDAARPTKRPACR